MFWSMMGILRRAFKHYYRHNFPEFFSNGLNEKLNQLIKQKGGDKIEK
jgi:hypothetical protein